MANSTPPQEVLLITIPFDAYPESYARLKELQPNLEVIHYNAGAGDEDKIPANVWARTTVHLTHSLFASDKKQCPNLKWVYLYSGGINQALHAPLLQDRLIHWTRNSGVHAPQIAEWVVGTLLAHYRQLPRLLKWQAEGVWRASEYKTRGDLLGKTVAFLGYGAIARHTARILSACGMRVVAYTLHAKTTPSERVSTTFTPANTGDPAGALPEAWYHGGLDAFLDAVKGTVDVLVVALPSTDKTRGALGAAQFEKLKDCYLINVARGDIIKTDELVTALNDGTLLGAALDVTDPEPLPQGHALWTARNAIVTPHISGVSDEYMPRTVEILDENLKRLHDGRPLINQIQREDGY
ncbi:hypothetical protein Sste5346_005405 [Sporothrix stenoceras]|uniref:D-isomer specific 2-hydroxyacid dehydrogenase NAD-binding domain-containing protein n=1 Tax=Sporothrix stenoceras TaxID=5173 RepID=A0ABR3Z619_9PEZI